MNYYQLVHRVDGDQEYSYIAEPIANSDGQHNFNKLNYFKYYKGKPFSLEFNIPSKYKILDLMHISSGNTPKLVVSLKFYDMLKAFNIQPHQSFSVKLHHKNKIYNMVWIHFTQSFNYNDIDFKKTMFEAIDRTPDWEVKTDGILGEFKVNNWQQFLELRQQAKNDFWNRKILPKDYLYYRAVLNWDLVFLDFRNLHKLFLVSETLADAIIEHKLTGIAIEQAPFDIIY